MGNLCLRDYYSSSYNHARYVKCKKCSVSFIKPNKIYHERRSCSIHTIRKNHCIICGTTDFTKKCYHVEKKCWF